MRVKKILRRCWTFMKRGYPAPSTWQGISSALPTLATSHLLIIWWINWEDRIWWEKGSMWAHGGMILATGHLGRKFSSYINSLCSFLVWGNVYSVFNKFIEKKIYAYTSTCKGFIVYFIVCFCVLLMLRLICS